MSTGYCVRLSTQRLRVESLPGEKNILNFLLYFPSKHSAKNCWWEYKTARVMSSFLKHGGSETEITNTSCPQMLYVFAYETALNL